MHLKGGTVILRERNVLTRPSLTSPVSMKVTSFLIKRHRPGQSSSTAFATRLPPYVPPGTQVRCPEIQLPHCEHEEGNHTPNMAAWEARRSRGQRLCGASSQPRACPGLRTSCCGQGDKEATVVRCVYMTSVKASMREVSG